MPFADEWNEEMQLDDWKELEGAAREAIENRPAAWHRSCRRLLAQLERWAAQLRFLRPFANVQDLCIDTVTVTWEKLEDRDFHGLRRYFAARERYGNPRPDGKKPARHPLCAWIYRVMYHAAIDQVHRLPEFKCWHALAAKDATDRGASVTACFTVELSEDIQPVSSRVWEHIALSQSLAMLEAHGRHRDYLVITLLLASYSYRDIARQLDMASPADVQRIRNTAIEWLKRRCRTHG